MKIRNILKIRTDSLVNYVRPAVDATTTMSSVVENSKGKIIGVVFTNMGKDGLEGSRKMKEKGRYNNCSR